MPGIPTSKGCEACRRRKKGCDLVQPTCGRCTKLGIKCINNGGGRLKFVDETDAWAQRNARSRQRSSPTTSEESPPDHQDTLTSLQISRLHQSALLSQAVDVLWTSYHPADPAFTRRANARYDRSSRWMRIALQEAHRDPGLNDAVSALALARMSRLIGDENTKQTALKYYGSCVQRVRQSITSPSKLHDDNLLATIMLLATFEVHEGSKRRDTAWGAHINGASRLINARGAFSLTSEFGKALYFGHLEDELVYGIGTRNKSRRGISTSTYLPTDWDEDRLDVQLLRILTTLPTIMEDADAIREQKMDIPILQQATLQLRDACHRTLNALEAFDDLLTASQYPEPLYTERPSALYASLPPTSPARVFPTYIHFTDLPIGSLQLVTWTSRLLMHSTLWLTYEWIRSRVPEAQIDHMIPMSTIPSHRVSVCDDLAVAIAKAMEFFLLPGMGLVGAQQLSYPVPIVLGYFKYWEHRGMGWIGVVFKRMKELGVGVEGFLADMFQGDEVQLIKAYDETPEERAQRLQETGFWDLSAGYRTERMQEIFGQ